MHIHVPKPLHGWRQFLGEVGVIVLGILIALGLEQLIETVHWRHKVEQAREALRGAAAVTATAAVEQQLVGQCVDRQLDLLEQRLLAPGAYRPVPRYRDPLAGDYVVRAPQRNWGDGVWQTINSEGIATHLPPATRARIDSVYASKQSMGEDARQANTMVQRLRMMALPLSLSTDSRTRLVGDVEELRGRESALTIGASQLVAQLAFAGLMPPAATWRRAVRQSGTVAFCRAHGLPLKAARVTVLVVR